MVFLNLMLHSALFHAVLSAALYTVTAGRVMGPILEHHVVDAFFDCIGHCFISSNLGKDLLSQIQDSRYHCQHLPRTVGVV